MLEFFFPTIDDKSWMEPILASTGRLGSEASFTSLFLWGNPYNVKSAKFNDFIIRAKFNAEEQLTNYFLPLGTGDIRLAISAIFEDAMSRGIDPTISSLYEEDKSFLETLYPNIFEFTKNRDFADYIYLQEDLSDLGGRKYHSKRNHIAKFVRSNTDYRLEPITEANKADALFISKEWCRLNSESCNIDHSERCALKSCFNNFEKLGVFGAILYIENKPVAMTIASQINETACEIHFEKALKVDGAYAFINNAFAKTLNKYTYINREEDMGLEGLRKAKLSYHPQILLNRYSAEALLTKIQNLNSNSDNLVSVVKSHGC